MHKRRHTTIPAVYLILERDNNILLLRRHNTGYCDGQFSLPAGHLNGGESCVQAMIREAEEEIGISLEPQEITLRHIMHRRSSESSEMERLDIFFSTQTWKGKISNIEPHKCSELIWVNKHKLPNDVIPYVAEAIAHSHKNNPYSDDWTYKTDS